MGFEEALHWSEYSKLLIGLLAIVNIPSSLFLFLALTSDFNTAQKRQVALTAAVSVALVLTIFNFFGTQVLELFGISIDSFRIAGGLLILLSALAMMTGGQAAPQRERIATAHTSVAITPLAVPSLAGPGAISTIIVYAHLGHLEENPTYGHEILVTLVILTVALLVYLALRMAPSIGDRLGETGIAVFNRVMGLVVAAIAVEFIAAGVLGFVP